MKRLFLAAAAASTWLAAPPAQAAVEICTTPNCAPAQANVLYDKTDTGVATVTGSVNGTTVLFTSPTGELLTAPANGQARAEADDGVLNGITFALENGLSFASANFNVFPLQSPGAASLIEIIYQLTNGGSGSQQFDISNGQNKFGIFGAPDGEGFLSITINGLPQGAGFHDLRQVKLGLTPVSAVPEPGTWMLMIVGIGAVGIALRRKRGVPVAA